MQKKARAWQSRQLSIKLNADMRAVTLPAASTGCIDDSQVEGGAQQVADDSCVYSNDGGCDEPAACVVGTDCTDCGNCGPLIRTSWHWSPADCPSCSCTPFCDTDTAPYISCHTLGLSGEELVVDAIGNTNATTLNFGSNRITELVEPSLFSGMTALFLLLLDHNDLRNVDQTVFQSLTALKALYLNDNRLSVVPPALFAGLARLEELYLHKNELERLTDPDVFSTLTALSLLSLHHNRLSTLHPDLFRSTPLSVGLDLSYNKLQALEDATIFGTLTAMATLRLDYNQLSGIPPTLLANLTRLTELHLQGNMIESLDDCCTFASLTRVTSMRLFENQISRLHPDLFRTLTSLTYLGAYLVTASICRSYCTDCTAILREQIPRCGLEMPTCMRACV